jgi:hypothetical protein
MDSDLKRYLMRSRSALSFVPTATWNYMDIKTIKEKYNE